MHYICRRALSLVKFPSPRQNLKSGTDESGIIKTDRFRLSVRAGRGGNGLQRYNGVGGEGGSVYVMSKPNYRFSHISTQLHNRHVVRAEAGCDAKQTKLVAEKGKDYIIHVPIGVEAVEKKTNILLARCLEPFKKHLLAKGGEGGSHLNKYQGMPGERLIVDLHLKLRPNVGLVGFPNAGKSTLLKSLVPEKKIKIASYPFTTIKPQICYVKDDCDPDDNLKEKFSLSVADLPGLIEGASKNCGRGFEFLKHLEYSNILLFIIDINGFCLKPTLGSPYRSPLDTVAILNAELEAYDLKLIQKPTVIAINKIDIENGKEKAQRLIPILKSKDWIKSVPEDIRPKNCIKFEEIIPISAKTGELANLKLVLKELFNSCFALKDPFVDMDDPEGDLGNSRGFM